MTRLEEFLRDIINLDEDKIWIASIKAQEDDIIALNTEDQLEEDGIDSKGVTLGEYSPFTKRIKASLGQRFDHITLKDTGEFYESFNITITRRDFTINANGQKDDTNLFDEYGNDILGLTDENTRIVQQETADYYRREFFRVSGI